MNNSKLIDEIVPLALDGERIDRAICLICDIPRSRATKLIVEGSVFLDGVQILVGKHKVVCGQRVQFDLSRIPTIVLPRAESGIELDIVYIDEEIIVVNKPAGMVVHPGAGNPDGTLVNALLDRFPEIALVGDQFRPGIVHRLDAGTTGLLVVARTSLAYESLVEQLTLRTVSRVYLALVLGHPMAKAGIIDAPIGRDQRDPTRMAVVGDGKQARTRYEVQCTFNLPAECSLVECKLETGRTHQIRVHLAALGHGVVGDKVYGGSHSLLRAFRPLLHAKTLTMTHPRTSYEMSFSSPTPPDFRAVLEKCS